MINRDYDLKIKEWIDENRERVTEKWIELCKIPSIKSEAKSGMPFGEECSKALNLAASFFDSENISNTVYEEEGYALAHYGKGEKTIGLFCHSDVVPVGDDWIFTKPFEPIVKDGALIGRGAEDNKSGIIAALCVMECLRDKKIPLKSKLQLFIGSDEECGMDDMKGFLKNHPMPEISIVPDADFPCSKGEKGIYHFMIKSKTAFSDIIDINGGMAYNIVLDNVTARIKFSEALYTELSHKLSSEFTLKNENNEIILTAKGVAKHASIPEGSVNAALLLFNLLSECDNLSESDRKILKNAAETIHCYYGEGIGLTHTDPVFGKMTSVNGMVKTENRALMLSFDVRYGSTLDPKELETTSEESVNSKGFEVISKNNSPGFSIPEDSEVPEAFEAIFNEITGENLKSVLMAGGTYARKLKNAFSIGTYYTSNERKEKILKMPDGHGGPHQCDEMIDLNSFFEAVRILVHYCLKADEIIN